jgi:1-acyl-sn-glycerol-3-phosphate acyltransferase
MSSIDGEHTGQFRLLTQARFGPLFWTQFLGAANDNLFKFAFTVLVTYQLQVSWLPPAQAGLVIGAVFIAPFLLFSATAGQLADSRDMATVMRLVKTLEIAIALVAAWGFLTAEVPALLACVFGMGLHSTMFGPVKYAYLPRHLSERELTGGNGMIEMGTFVAILLGNVAGGLLVAIPVTGARFTAGACVALAVLGRVVVQRVPRTPPTDAGLRLNWNPVSETWRNLRLAGAKPAVFRSLLGVSWLWFLGALFLSLFPAFAKDVLGGDSAVASLLLVVFSVGIGTGSLLCERLSRRHVEIGLVPVGAIGMTVFTLDLYVASRGFLGPTAPGIGAFVGTPGAARILGDLGLLSLSAGLYSVPMYALIQLRSPAGHRARIFAAGNILSAVFTLASAGFGAGLLALGLSIPQVFGVAGLLTAAVAGYVFRLVPEYLLRFAAFLLTRCSYRFRVVGEQHIPVDGPAVVVANHVSFVDAILLMAASPRPIRFVMDHRIFAVPVLGWLFRLSGAIPIAPQREDPAVYRAAFEAADAVLADGGLLGIFPEGAITRDGSLQPFRGGIMKILVRRPVPVVPVALRNLWGSYFSRAESGRAMVRPFRRGLWNRVELVAGPPVAADAVTPAGLRDRVAELTADPATRDRRSAARAVDG